MKRFLIFPVLLILLFGTPAFADAVGGSEAHNSGDYADELEGWKAYAEQGYATAQYNLGLMYYLGQGVTQNNEAAFKWFKLAAAQGYERAQVQLGFDYRSGKGVIQDYTSAHMWWNIAASQGNP